MEWINLAYNSEKLAGSCDYGNEPSGVNKIRGTPRLTEELVASQGRLYSMDLVAAALGEEKNMADPSRTIPDTNETKYLVQCAFPSLVSI